MPINYFKSGGTFTNIDITKLEGYSSDDELRNDIAWSTEKVDKLIKDYQEGNIELGQIKGSPFKERNILLRKPNLMFQYTREEIEELKKCSKDPIYFADKYCKLQTDDGFVNIKVRDYQQGLLEGMLKHNKCIMLCSRQLGKTTTTAIFVLWFILFNKEKNVLLLGNTFDTTVEVIDKVKNILNFLPFFMKPGIVVNNQKSVKFDNGCRIIGRTTTKASAIGLSIDLLYLDEFAHVAPNTVDAFWRSVYPVVSARKNSRIIITSTPNGLNKFHAIWCAAIDGVAVDGKSTFFPMRVDWWQEKSHNEAWKEMIIAELGSVEQFNQEYGLQFFSGDNLLLNSTDVKKLYNIKTKYVSRPIKCLYLDKTYYKDKKKYKTSMDFSEYMTWHPKFLETTFTSDMNDLKSCKDYFIFGIDTSKGVGVDFHVINVFKVARMSINRMLMNRNNIHDPLDTFSLIQVGTFRINTVNIETFSDIVNAIAFELFDPDHVRIGLELNQYGILVRDKIENNSMYWDGIILYTKKSETNPDWEPGTDLNSNKKKATYCEKLQQYVAKDRIITTEAMTFTELSNFGSNENRTVYRCQIGHDDLAISTLHASVFLESLQYIDICEELFEEIHDKEWLKVFDNDVIAYNEERLGERSEILPSDIEILN